MAVGSSLPRAFAILYKDLERWDTTFFRGVGWRWSKECFVPIGSLLERRILGVDPRLPDHEKPIIEKISFGGELVITQTEARKGYKGRLFWAHDGDFIYSKIRVKQGSCTIIPATIPSIAVSAEYPVYSIRTGKVLPNYFALLIRCAPFMRVLDGLSHGSSTKTRIHPSQFEAIRIPIPPLPVQQTIVARWKQAQKEIVAGQERILCKERETAERFIRELGLTPTKPASGEKAFAVLWKDFARWSVSYNHTASSLPDLTKGKFPVVSLGAILEMVQYGTSVRANTKDEGTPVIRMNNIRDGVLDFSDLKHVALPEKVRKSLSLRKGDILINRTNSKELVGKCGVFDEEGEYVFASYLIRLCADLRRALPEYLASVINSPIGRLQIDALSRQIIGQANINSKELRSLQIPLPPLQVQQEILRKIFDGRAEVSKIRAAVQEIASDSKREIEALILGTKTGMRRSRTEVG